MVIYHGCWLGLDNNGENGTITLIYPFTCSPCQHEFHSIYSPYSNKQKRYEQLDSKRLNLTRLLTAPPMYNEQTEIVLPGHPSRLPSTFHTYCGTTFGSRTTYIPIDIISTPYLEPCQMVLPVTSSRITILSRLMMIIADCIVL